MFPTSTLLLALHGGALAAPQASLLHDTIEVPWSGPQRRRGGEPRETLVVFLNFDGQSLNCAGDFAHSNNSFIVCSNPTLADVPPFSPAGYSCGSIGACKETIRSMLGAFWSERWNIRFVTTRPEDADYEMAMIGGTLMPGVLGLAPLDCSNANPNTVSFSFSNDAAGLPNPEQALVTTISHELAHALGQCHNNNMTSVMFPAVDSGGGMQQWDCGKPVDGCPCPGADATCPPDYFDDLLGPPSPDTEAPVVHVLAPLSGLSVPSQINLRAMVRDDRIMATVEVEVGGVAVGSVAPEISGIYNFHLPPLPSGHSRICVLGTDLGGNRGQDCVNVTVDPSAVCVPGDCCCGAACCEDSATCDCAGRLPNGEPCELDGDCRGGLCEDNPWDEESRGFCTEGCADDGECAPGEACVRDSSGRGQCWSYVLESGFAAPCSVDDDVDCPGRLVCVFPDGCTEVALEDGVGEGPCVGDGFCSLPCGGGESCTAPFVCSSVGDGQYCRFAGIAADVSGGCGIAPSRPAARPSLVILLALVALCQRRSGRRRA